MDEGSQTFIHPSSIVEPGAKLGAGVRIGPFCHVGPQAVLGDGVSLLGHVSIMGDTTIGEGCTIYPQAALGAPPQNLKHKGGRTTLVIGRNCTIRESVSVHVGTDVSRAATRIGDNCFLMAYSHVAHDCTVGNNVTFANGVMVGGHCEIDDFVTIGGLAAIHQFVRIGHHAFIGGCSALVGDVIPYGMAAGNRANLRGLNIVGMKRSGLPRPEIHALRRAYRMIFDHDWPFSENVERAAEEFADSQAVLDIVAFIRDRGKRPYCVPAVRGGNAPADDAEAG